MEEEAHIGPYLDGDAECRQRVDEGSGPEGEVIDLLGVGHRSEISKNLRDLIWLPLALGLAHEIDPFADERLGRESRREGAAEARGMWAHGRGGRAHRELLRQQRRRGGASLVF